MKKIFFFLFLLLALDMSAQKLRVASPDGNIQMEINNGNRLSYSVTYGGKKLIGDSPLGFEFKMRNPCRQVWS